MPVSRKVLGWSLSVALVALAAVVSCQRPKGGVPVLGVNSTAHCPYHDSVRLETDQGTVTFDTLPLVGLLTTIPEFHDCQRFIDSSGGRYGPLVGIFAVATLSGFELTPGTPPPRADFREPPGTEDPAAADEPVAPVPPHPEGWPVGVIVNFDQVEYAPLGIKPGINCLYVYPSSERPHGIAARVVPVGSDAQACAAPFSPAMVGTELLAFARRMPLDHPSDYPPVARWDWDPKSSTQFIGISCGRRWCEIGQGSGFSPSPTHLYFLTDRKERRVFAVKGWHDEQWLGRNGIAGLYPAPYQGTLVPVKNLAEMDATTFGTPQWTEVARVAISPHDPAYEDKFTFTTANMPGRMNTIALCQGSWTACIATDAPASAPGAAPNCKGTTDGMWWARITNTRGDKAYRCVTRRPHVGITMPGTARWLWSDDDESIWVECDEGCCQVHNRFM